MNIDWRLTVADVLERPLFQHAEVIAGHQGLARPIRWVHVLEAAENGAFLNGGELILSTGLGFGDHPEKRLSYLDELVRRNTAGLCLELGIHVPTVTTDMIEQANRHQFPLIVFHQPVRFVDITLDLHEWLVNRQMAALRRLERFSRDLQQLSLQMHSIPRVLQHFHAAVQVQTFFLPRTGTPVFSPVMARHDQQELSAWFQRELPCEGVTGAAVRELMLPENKWAVVQPIVAMDHVLAFLGVILLDRQRDEYLLLALDATASVIAQLLLRTMYAEERARAHEQQVLEDILTGRIRQEEQIRSLLGIEQSRPAAPYWMVVINTPPACDLQKAHEQYQSMTHELNSIYRSILERHGYRSVIHSRGNRHHLLITGNPAGNSSRQPLLQAFMEMERINKTVAGFKGRMLIGVSRPSNRYADIPKRLQEAEQAMLMQPVLGTPFFEELGVYRLFSTLREGEVLSSLVQDYLGPIIRHDKETGSQLLHTLRVYLEQNQSKQETADRLFIHRQTLYHRLEKIRELLGNTYMEPKHRLCLEIALHAFTFMHAYDRE